MKPSKNKQPRSGRINPAARSLKFAWLSALAAALSILGHRFAIIEFQPALFGIVVSVLTGLAAMVTGLTGTLHAFKNGQPEIVSTMAGSTLGALVVVPFLFTLLAGADHPRIHDITTDLEHPPQFIAIKSLRTTAHNSLDRAEPERLEALQKAGYPDLGPLLMDKPYDQVFDQVIALASARGWDVVSASVAAGRIEATDTTPVMGFKDDVVIRMQRMENKTRVDMRSVSRVGQSDLGVNAARIRAFLADLEKK